MKKESKKIKISVKEYGELLIKAETYNRLVELGWVEQWIQDSINKKIIELQEKLELNIEPPDKILH